MNENAIDLVSLSADAANLLKLRRIPVGMKFFDTLEEALQVPKLRMAKGKFTVCQLIAQAVQFGWTVGLRRGMTSIRYCGTINGMYEKNELFTSGRMLNGVWHENLEAAAAHNEGLWCMEQKEAIAVSPLSSGRLEPDVVLIYGTPGQMFMLLSGLINKDYRRLSFPFGGESTCSVSWVRTALTGEPGLSVGCFAERKFGGLEDGEMLATLTPADFQKAVDGLKTLSKAGLRYPIHNYTVLRDAADGMPQSYLDDV